MTPFSRILRCLTIDINKDLGSITGLSIDISLLRVSACSVSVTLSCIAEMPSTSFIDETLMPVILVTYSHNFTTYAHSRSICCVVSIS